MNQEWYTQAELAALLGVSLRKIQRYTLALRKDDAIIWRMEHDRVNDLPTNRLLVHRDSVAVVRSKTYPKPGRKPAATVAPKLCAYPGCALPVNKRYNDFHSQFHFTEARKRGLIATPPRPKATRRTARRGSGVFQAPITPKPLIGAPTH